MSSEPEDARAVAEQARQLLLRIERHGRLVPNCMSHECFDEKVAAIEAALTEAEARGYARKADEVQHEIHEKDTVIEATEAMVRWLRKERDTADATGYARGKAEGEQAQATRATLDVHALTEQLIALPVVGRTEFANKVQALFDRVRAEGKAEGLREAADFIDGLSAWVRDPGNINRDDVQHDAAMAIRNAASSLRQRAEAQTR